MAENKVMRTKTKYVGIYFNESTKKFDIKVNYKVYNPIIKKNEYKAKWVYAVGTITQAKIEKERLNSEIKGGKSIEDKDITLRGIFEVWKEQARADDLSPSSFQNTENEYKIISRYLGEDYLLKNANEDDYIHLISKCREYGYSENTIFDVNKCFKKFIRLAFRKKYLKENPLARAKSIKINKNKFKNEKKVLKYREFEKLDEYFKNTSFTRLGVDCYPNARLLFNILYFTGIRVGEALALTHEDFEDNNFEYLDVTFANEDIARDTMNLRINKNYLSQWKIIRKPKSGENRVIPLHADVVEIYNSMYNSAFIKNDMSEIKPKDKLFNFDYGNAKYLLTKACVKCGLKHFTCHEFRHTYISNLVREGVSLAVIEKVSGDSQKTILYTYSHYFEKDVARVMTALNNCKTVDDW